MSSNGYNKLEPFERWIIYYMLLGFVQAVWTNLSTFPPLPLRIGMILAVFAPVLTRRELILFAIPFSMTLRGYLSTGYSFLPDVWSYWFYFGIEILALIIHNKQLNFVLFGKAKSLIVMALFFCLADFVANGEIGTYAIHIALGLLLIPFLKKETDLHLLSAAIITVSVLLSAYYIIMFDKFLEAWGNTGIERSGWTDPNYFSVTLDAGFFLAIIYNFGICKSERPFFNKRVLSISCIIIAIAVIMTASRAGFLCILFSFFIALFSAKLRPYHFIVALLVVAITGLYVYYSGKMDVLLYRLFEQDNIQTGGDRTTIWGTLLENFNKQDMFNKLFGGGYWHRRDLAPNDTHNEFLAILGDYGYLGIVLYIIFLISIANFRKGIFMKQNVAIVFYLLSCVSLSPFSYIYIMFLILWIYAFKFHDDNLLEYE